MNSKIVIIGGAGFIGTATAKKLHDNGYNVLILDTGRRLERSKMFHKNLDVEYYDFHSSEIVDRFFRGAYAVIHMGCSTIPSSSMRSLTDEALLNVAPSVRVFEAAYRQGVSRILFTSSGGTVYGDTVNFPISEDTVLSPISAYGASKVAIESYLQVAVHTYGFTGISLRIANPYGPYQLQGSPIGVIARYILESRAGKDLVIWGDGSIVRDYIYIDDLTDAFVAAVKEGDIKSGAYNLGSGTGIALNTIVDLISQHSNAKVNVTYQSERVFDVKKVILDINKFSNATHWSPRIDIEEGILKLFNN